MRKNEAAANYVAALSVELAKIAHHHGLDTAAYMLEIAALEAARRKPNSGDAARRPPAVTTAGATAA
jgi:hypothetical protein